MKSRPWLHQRNLSPGSWSVKKAINDLIYSPPGVGQLPLGLRFYLVIASPTNFMPVSHTQPENSLCLFFTFGMTLQEWKRTGLIDREILVYNALVKKGYNVAFFTYGDASDFELAHLIPGITLLPALTKCRPARTRIGRFFLSLLFPFLWRKELKKFQIYKTNQLLGFWVPLLAKWLGKNRKLLVRCGYEHYRFSVHQKKSAFKRAGLYLLSKVAYRTADHILITTQDAAQFIQKTFGIAPGKITVCPNLIDTQLFAPQPSHAVLPRLVFIGRFSEQKNLFSLLEAVKRAGAGLDIYGKGELENAVRGYISQYGIDAVLKGVVPNKEIPQVLSRYAAYVLPSHYEGNPKTLLEAMSCGQAVIGTNVEGIREIIVDGENGILCEGDSQSLAAAIEKIRSHPSLKRTLGEKARHYILETCSLERILKIEMGTYASTH